MTSVHIWHASMIQLTSIVWFLCVSAGFLRLWDYGGYLTSQLGIFFNLSLAMGKLKFSVKGIAAALVIIFVTQSLVRVGRAMLKERILEKHSFERGLADSILTITSYLGWAISVVLALSALGVDTTSVAVVFGALSVGIGFGLQNIFNNFFSGLILLFERPIQVGDIIEIKGEFAKVKKINVRSTVVQTLDNASLIIPNADFISNQVTNWNFKDKRARRNIDVGVAYDSDVDLVEKTLLEIAEDNSIILKYPQPEVLFIDHAASALILRLRVWVNMDKNIAIIPSTIRREIDRRFRELNITIAYPQQDMHIRTIADENLTRALKQFLEKSTPGEFNSEKNVTLV